MNPYTNEVVRNLNDVPVDKLKDFVAVTEELQAAAEEVLDGRPAAKATTDTEAGRKLIEFAKKEKRRRKNKAARKARRRNRG